MGWKGRAPISVNLSRASAGECILSRRDSMIVSQVRSAWVAMQKDPVPGDGAIFLITPGTSCLATISLSLRDKSRSALERLALS